MRCRYCGTSTNLCTERERDEDGYLEEFPVDLCHDCVEHDLERSRARSEWNHYEGTPCPEIELPQPAPKRWS